MRRYLHWLKPREFAIRRQRCTLCDFPLLLRLRCHEHAVRCPRCRAGAVHMAIAAVIRDQRPRLAREAVYELSSRGPLYRMLKRSSGRLQVSEYFDDVAPGTSRDGVVCQNVEQLTFPDRSFDLCTSTDVFEHVVDDGAGFRELHRVLRPGGQAIFTVPIDPAGDTLERAVYRDGELHHLQPPEYHDDHLRGRGRVLAYRSYGRDITDRLKAAGFSEARIDARFSQGFFGYGRAVIVADV
ncbi:MAG: methyltransferase domain-containing protein [Wenzhouxiangellaceae bacterium]|nr:methyltransferase domain-containing protein [Wenzhouxiangellaceae bacterium]